MQRVKVHFEGATGMISSLTVGGVNVPLKQNLMWYAGRNQGHERIPVLILPQDRSSGAYIFRPNDTDAYPISEQATIIAIFQGFFLYNFDLYQLYKF